MALIKPKGSNELEGLHNDLVDVIASRKVKVETILMALEIIRHDIINQMRVKAYRALSSKVPMSVLPRRKK